MSKWFKKHWLFFGTVLMLAAVWARTLALMLTASEDYFFQISYSAFLLTAFVIGLSLFMQLIRKLLAKKG